MRQVQLRRPVHRRGVLDAKPVVIGQPIGHRDVEPAWVAPGSWLARHVEPKTAIDPFDLAHPGRQPLRAAMQMMPALGGLELERLAVDLDAGPRDAILDPTEDAAAPSAL